MVKKRFTVSLHWWIATPGGPWAGLSQTPPRQPSLQIRNGGGHRARPLDVVHRTDTTSLSATLYGRELLPNPPSQDSRGWRHRAHPSLDRRHHKDMRLSQARGARRPQRVRGPQTDSPPSSPEGSSRSTLALAPRTDFLTSSPQNSAKKLVFLNFSCHICGHW